MKEFAAGFYGSARWKKCRAAFVAERVRIDGGLCQICHDRLGFIVHHKIELTPENIDDVTVSLNHRNLQYVCLECHNREHGYFAPGEAACTFDADGNVMPPSPRSAG